MSSSLQDILSTSYTIPCIIGGKVTTTENKFEVVDPHRVGDVLHEVYGANPKEAAAAIDAAAAALPAWKNTSLRTREEIARKALAICRDPKHCAEFTDIMTRETTIAKSFGELNCLLAAGIFEGVIASLEAALKTETVEAAYPGQTAHIYRVPYGVVLGIPPWNAPLVLAARAALNPIMAGNTCVLKTSDLSPLGNLIIAKVMDEPDYLLEYSMLFTSVRRTLLRKVNFTGSTRVGSLVAELCGRYVKPVTLELGGAAVAVVFEDADIEWAAKNVAYGAFHSSGQICMSTNNTLVHESVVDKFVAALQKELGNKARAGASTDPGANLIRGVFTDKHAENVSSLVDNAIQHGAKVVVGDENEAGKYHGGNIVHPTVLNNVTSLMRIANEEIFGPALGIIHFSTDEEALGIINSSDYGLTSSVFSQDEDRASKFAAQMEVGIVHVNSQTVNDSWNIPHGGMKKSGYGRFNGFEGLREFTQTKTTTFLNRSLAPPVAPI